MLYKLKENWFLGIKKVMTLAFFVGALPLIFSASAYAKESRWLDDYKKPVGFTYGVEAKFQTTYIWRALYCGGMNVQLDANVGYGGLYADMWWNIGTSDWSFSKFQPEVDVSIGFKRWGINLFLLWVHNFNCGFFDITNYPDKGNRVELNLCYTVSSKLPLGFIWATRVSGADGYLNAAGDTIRAYSTYIQLSYTHHFKYDISLYGAIGITPWKSCYTHYQGDFAVQNIQVSLRKDWSLSEHCGMSLFGDLTISPTTLAKDPSTAQWKPMNPSRQAINANIGVGVYLK